MLRFIYRVYQIYLFFVRPLTFGVRVLLVRRGRVLLVRQTYMNGWFIPGGGVQEVQAELKQISLVGVYSNFQEWKSDHNVLFYSDKFTLGGGHDNEIAEMRFFPLDALPAGLWPGHRQRLLEFGPDLARGRVPSSPRFGEW
jgi:hypothetical protein